MMPKAAAAQVNLAQSVEEQEASLHDRVLEFAQDELEWGQRTDFHQQPPLGALPQQVDSPLGRDWWRLALRDENALNNGQEIISPSPKAGLILRTKTAERCGGFFEVGPPFQRVSIPQNERHVELRLQIDSSVIFQLEIAIPGRAIERSVVERVCVVEEARVTRVLLGRKAAARNVPGGTAPDANGSASIVQLAAWLVGAGRKRHTAPPPHQTAKEASPGS